MDYYTSYYFTTASLFFQSYIVYFFNFYRKAIFEMRKLSDKTIVRIAVLLISCTFFIIIAGSLSLYDEFDHKFRSYMQGEASRIISNPPVVLTPDVQMHINKKRILL